MAASIFSRTSEMVFLGEGDGEGDGDGNDSGVTCGDVTGDGLAL